MAITQGTETVALTIEERTWRLEIFIEKGTDPTVRAHREVVKTDAAGNVVAKDPSAVVERQLSKVASQSFAIGGKTYTGAEIANVLAAVVDTWRQEDLAAVG
jgi:hypothetical protein